MLQHIPIVSGLNKSRQVLEKLSSCKLCWEWNSERVLVDIWVRELGWWISVTVNYSGWNSKPSIFVIDNEVIEIKTAPQRCCSVLVYVDTWLVVMSSSQDLPWYLLMQDGCVVSLRYYRLFNACIYIRGRLTKVSIYIISMHNCSISFEWWFSSLISLFPFPFSSYLISASIFWPWLRGDWRGGVNADANP